MSQNIDQIFIANPASSMQTTDLLYLGRTPFGASSDFAITFANFQSSITAVGTIATGVWHGTVIAGTYGGTGVNNGASTFTIGGNTSFVGASTFAGTLTGNTAVTFPTSGTLATTSQLATPAALTKVDDTNVTLTLGGTPTTALLQATSLTLGWSGLLAVARGGTGVSSVTTSPTATSFAGWDANSNMFANNFNSAGNVTSAAGGTITLTAASPRFLYPTAGVPQTIVMPVVSTLTIGTTFTIYNPDYHVFTVQSSGANTIGTFYSNQSSSIATLTCIAITGTTAASWIMEVANLNGSLTGNAEFNSIAVTNSPHFTGVVWGTTSTVTAAGSTNLDGNFNQVFTGATTQTAVLPSTSGNYRGINYFITNKSSGTVTVNANDGSTVSTIAAGTSLYFINIDNSNNSNTQWAFH